MNFMNFIGKELKRIGEQNKYSTESIIINGYFRKNIVLKTRKENN